VPDWKLEPARDLGLPFGERLRSHRREVGLVETALHHGWWGLVRGYMAVLHQLRTCGAEHLPARPPFVLVANHASHYDAIVLASILPWQHRDRIFSIAAGDTFFDTPVRAAFAAAVLNALPLWRRKASGEALKTLRERLLEEPCAYILFPEGTRTRDGSMGKFKAGLGMLVAGTAVPVVPSHLDGTFEVLPPHRTWPRPGRIVVRIGQPLTFASVVNERRGWQEIAQATEGAVRRLAGPRG
jgi:1-acyl-sn-glycerol-3-phosphate acyltransferase